MTAVGQDLMKLYSQRILALDLSNEALIAYLAFRMSDGSSHPAAAP